MGAYYVLQIVELLKALVWRSLTAPLWRLWFVCFFLTVGGLKLYSKLFSVAQILQLGSERHTGPRGQMLTIVNSIHPRVDLISALTAFAHPCTADPHSSSVSAPKTKC